MHTSPNEEEDISRLQAAFHASRVYEFIRGRTIQSKDKAPNYVGMGSDPVKLKRAFEKWTAGRDMDRSTREVWNQGS